MKHTNHRRVTALAAAVGLACAGYAVADQHMSETYGDQSHPATKHEQNVDASARQEMTTEGTHSKDSDSRKNMPCDSHAMSDHEKAHSEEHRKAELENEVSQLAASFGVSELNDIENWKITNSGEEVGEIDRIGIDSRTGEMLAVVGLEGVVGANMKEVGVPLKNLKMAGDETLSTDLTKDELQRKRDIDPWDGTFSQILSLQSSRKSLDAARQPEVRQLVATFGVSELNDIEDWKITNSGEELGEIDRIGIDATTGELLAVVGLKGVVGVNMKEVGVPLKKLRMAGEETLSTELTKEELQSKRDIDPWDGTFSQIVRHDTSQ